MSARDELEQLLDANPPEWNADLLDAYRAEVLREAWEKLRRFVEVSPDFPRSENPFVVGIRVADIIKPEDEE